MLRNVLGGIQMENRIFHLRYSVASLVGIRSLRLSVTYSIRRRLLW